MNKMLISFSLWSLVHNAMNILTIADTLLENLHKSSISNLQHIQTHTFSTNALHLHKTYQVHVEKLKRSSSVDLWSALVRGLCLLPDLAFSIHNIKFSLKFMDSSNKTTDSYFLHGFEIQKPHSLVPYIHLVRLADHACCMRSCLTNSEQVTVI